MSKHDQPRASRVEWLLIGALTFVGAILRFWSFARLGLTHFDEGIYASSGIWSLSPDGLASLDPGVLSYAPPGFPILVGISYSVLGVSDKSALLVSIVVGTLTIPLAGWLGKRLFGSGAGVAAAAFVALAMVHVAFSRKALTDVSFLATWLIAIGLGARFLEKPNLIRAIAMGMAVGLAQNFKYNGWLAGVIVLVAALLGLIQDQEERKSARSVRTFAFGVIGAFVAALVYLPWFQFVERHGGYSALLAHQRSYMGGVESWLFHLGQQAAQSYDLSGGFLWSALTWTVAVSGAAFMLRGASLRTFATIFPTLAILGIAFGLTPQLGILGGLVLVLITFRRPRSQRSGSLRILAAWWLVMIVMTPFYHPYARLWMPLHAFDWILFAGLCSWITRAPETAGSEGGISWFRVGSFRRKWNVALAYAFAIALVVVVQKGIWRLAPGPPTDLFQPTDSLRTAIYDLVGRPERITIPDGVTLRVLGRRPVAFYLGVMGRVPFRLLADREEILDGPQSPNEWILIDEAQFDQDGDSEVAWRLVRGRWRMVGSWATPLDPVTLFDVRPEAAWRNDERAVPRLWLFAPLH